MAAHGLKNEKKDALDRTLALVNVNPEHEKILLVQAHLATRFLGNKNEAYMLHVGTAKKALREACAKPNSLLHKSNYNSFHRYFLSDVGHLT